MLKEQFSTAHRDFRPQDQITYGVDWLDAESLLQGKIYELSSRCFGDGARLIGEILASVFRQQQRLVLIDGSDCFDPSILPVFGDDTYNLDGSFAWARCRSVKEAVQIADMILRDGNLPRTVMDLQNNSLKEIRSIPRSNWLRLRALAEDSGVSCLVLTTETVIPNAAGRIDIPPSTAS